jgi:hypothetical protein
MIFNSLIMWPEARSCLVDDTVTRERKLMSPDGETVAEYIRADLLEDLQQSQKEGATDYLPSALMEPFGYYLKANTERQLGK